MNCCIRGIQNDGSSQHQNIATNMFYSFEDQYDIGPDAIVSFKFYDGFEFLYKTTLLVSSEFTTINSLSFLQVTSRKNIKQSYLYTHWECKSLGEYDTCIYNLLKKYNLI